MRRRRERELDDEFEPLREQPLPCVRVVGVVPEGAGQGPPPLDAGDVHLADDVVLTLRLESPDEKRAVPVGLVAQVVAEVFRVDGVPRFQALTRALDGDRVRSEIPGVRCVNANPLAYSLPTGLRRQRGH